jgi:hypothetical protein
MKRIPFKENDEVTIPGDENKYIIMEIGYLGISTIVCGSIKKRMHWSEFDTSTNKYNKHENKDNSKRAHRSQHL